MAQLAQLAQSQNCRNTRDSTIRKSRGFTFTLNNYTTSELQNIQNAGGFEYVFQEETGAEGTPHLQGGLYYKNAVSFRTVKKLIPRAHIERMRNWHATKNYCSKGESRTGAIYTNIRDFVKIDTVVHHQLTFEERIKIDLLEKIPDFSEENGNEALFESMHLMDDLMSKES